MNEFMRSILSRVLSEEIAFQDYLGQIEDNEAERCDNTNKILDWMIENGVPFNQLYYWEKLEILQ